jgi:ABC-type sugar transport system permease subunit
MQKKAYDKASVIRLVSTTVTAVFSCLVGALFIVQVWRIFSLGNKSFTTENIQKYFSQIALFVWLFIAIVLANAVIGCVYPKKQEKLRGEVDQQAISNRLQKRLSPERAESIVWQTEKIRFLIGFISLCICISALALSVAVLLAENYEPIATQGFFADHNEAERLLVCMPFIIVAIVAAAAFSYFKNSTYKIEIKLLKSAIAEKDEAPVEPIKRGVWGSILTAWKRVKAFFRPLSSKKATFYIRLTLGVTAVAFIVWGICNGGMADVLEKAINICTQCIGLG